MMLQLDIEGREDLGIAAGNMLRLFPFPLPDQACNLPLAAAGESGQTVRPGSKIVEGDMRIVLVIQLCLGDDAAEVTVALAVPREQDEMGAPLLGRQTHLGAEDWFDALGSGCLQETDGAVEAVVVGKGEGGHPELGGPEDQTFRG